MLGMCIGSLVFDSFLGVAERVFLQLLYARKRHLPKLFRSLTEHVETNYRPALVFVPHCFAELVSLSEEQHGRGFNAVVRSTPILGDSCSLRRKITLQCLAWTTFAASVVGVVVASFL